MSGNRLTSRLAERRAALARLGKCPGSALAGVAWVDYGDEGYGATRGTGGSGRSVRKTRRGFLALRGRLGPRSDIDWNDSLGRCRPWRICRRKPEYRLFRRHDSECGERLVQWDSRIV